MVKGLKAGSTFSVAHQFALKNGPPLNRKRRKSGPTLRQNKKYKAP